MYVLCQTILDLLLSFQFSFDNVLLSLISLKNICLTDIIYYRFTMISSSLYLCTLLTLSLAAETCYEGPGGASPTDARAGGHNIQVTKAMISKPAPEFSGTAVVNGEFT